MEYLGRKLRLLNQGLSELDTIYVYQERLAECAWANFILSLDLFTPFSKKPAFVLNLIYLHDLGMLDLWKNMIYVRHDDSRAISGYALNDS